MVGMSSWIWLGLGLLCLLLAGGTGLALTLDEAKEKGNSKVSLKLGYRTHLWWSSPYHQYDVWKLRDWILVVHTEDKNAEPDVFIQALLTETGDVTSEDELEIPEIDIGDTTLDEEIEIDDDDLSLGEEETSLGTEE